MPSKTKTCPFCAETIQARAVKCRFCGEFLYGDRRNSIPLPSAADNDDEEQTDSDQQDDDGVLFWARPSLWAMSPAVVKAAVMLAIAALLMFLPFEEFLIRHFGHSLTDAEARTIAHYTAQAGMIIAVVTMMILLIKAAILKSTHYEVTADRIEWSRGIFDRKVDNIDMFRVVDLKMHRSLLDCLVGVGTVTLITKDPSDPKFSLLKVPQPRLLYDIIKKASLDADRTRDVIHLE